MRRWRPRVTTEDEEFCLACWRDHAPRLSCAEVDEEAMADAMVYFHGMMQEELEALGMDPSIADRLAQPMFLRLVREAQPDA